MRADWKRAFSWKSIIVYGAGALLTGVGFVVFNFIGGDSILTVRATWALIRGLTTWILLLCPQLLLQWTLRKRIRLSAGSSLLKEVVITNCPIAVLLFAMLVARYLGTTPRSTFEKLVMKPIPESVADVQRGRLVAMDFAFWVLRFKIGSNDLLKLIRNEHFKPISGEDIGQWDERIRQNVKMEANLTEAWQFYVSENGKSVKHLFINTNTLDAIFVLQY